MVKGIIIIISKSMVEDNVDDDVCDKGRGGSVMMVRDIGQREREGR